MTLCPPCVDSKNIPVCTFKTSPCVLTPRAHVSTHVRVVPAYTGTFWMYTWRRSWSPNTGFSTFFCVPQLTHTPNTHHDHQQHHATTMTHTTQHNTQHHTETETEERERETEKERQRKRDKKRRQEKMREKREERREKREERREKREERREKREERREDKRRDKMKKKMKRDKDERKSVCLWKMFQNPQTRHMNKPNMFRKKNPFWTNYSSIFSSKVQNLTVFSIIYMIRIRFFGPRELIQKNFRRAR